MPILSVPLEYGIELKMVARAEGHRSPHRERGVCFKGQISRTNNPMRSRRHVKGAILIQAKSVAVFAISFWFGVMLSCICICRGTVNARLLQQERPKR